MSMIEQASKRLEQLSQAGFTVPGNCSLSGGIKNHGPEFSPPEPELYTRDLPFVGLALRRRLV